MSTNEQDSITSIDRADRRGKFTKGADNFCRCLQASIITC